jgi:hypothetical protein
VRWINLTNLPSQWLRINTLNLNGLQMQRTVEIAG